MNNSTAPSIYVTKIDLQLASRIKLDLEQQGFLMSIPPHTVFSAKKKGLSCTLYKSGKMTVQGKEMRAFIEFYLEPHVLQNFDFSHPPAKPSCALPQTAHIGIDESGKGDFFGPLCVAGVYADAENIAKLQALGVKDSKTLSDASILKLAKLIQATTPHHIVKINPPKYNELYSQFKNLNRLLAWGHATAIEALVMRTNCQDVIVDQFADQHVVLTALQRKKLEVNLTQRHKAEEDIVVAAASILARQTFLLGLQSLGQEYGLLLPKGASKLTIAAGKQFVQKYGKDALHKVCKLHFKTTNEL